MPEARESVDPEVAERWQQRRLQVGRRLRAERTRAGLTQEALALESGLSRNVLIELEWGRRSVLFERLYDLANALDIPVRVLLEEELGRTGQSVRPR